MESMSQVCVCFARRAEREALALIIIIRLAIGLHFGISRQRRIVCCGVAVFRFRIISEGFQRFAVVWSASENEFITCRVIPSIARLAMRFHHIPRSLRYFRYHEIWPPSNRLCKFGGPARGRKFGICQTLNLIFKLPKGNVIYLAPRIKTRMDLLHDHPFYGVREQVFRFLDGKTSCY